MPDTNPDTIECCCFLDVRHAGCAAGSSWLWLLLVPLEGVICDDSHDRAAGAGTGSGGRCGVDSIAAESRGGKAAGSNREGRSRGNERGEEGDSLSRVHGRGGRTCWHSSRVLLLVLVLRLSVQMLTEKRYGKPPYNLCSSTQISQSSLSGGRGPKIATQNWWQT